MCVDKQKNPYNNPDYMSDMSLCWFCQRACYGRFKMCEWAKDSVPVDGWSARNTTDAHQRENASKRHTFYRVDDCPKFVPDEKVYAACLISGDPQSFFCALRRHYGANYFKSISKVYNIVKSKLPEYCYMDLDAKRGFRELKTKLASESYIRQKIRPIRRIISREDGEKVIVPLMLEHDFKVVNAPICKRILKRKNGVLWKVDYTPTPKEPKECKMRDCVYAGYRSGWLCDYLEKTGHFRTIERVNGKVIRKHLICDGKCDLYTKDETKAMLTAEAEA